jgi:hypothetical protein
MSESVLAAQIDNVSLKQEKIPLRRRWIYLPDGKAEVEVEVEVKRSFL